MLLATVWIHWEGSFEMRGCGMRFRNGPQKTRWNGPGVFITEHCIDSWGFELRLSHTTAIIRAPRSWRHIFCEKSTKSHPFYGFSGDSNSRYFGQKSTRGISGSHGWPKGMTNQKLTTWPVGAFDCLLSDSPWHRFSWLMSKWLWIPSIKAGVFGSEVVNSGAAGIENILAFDVRDTCRSCPISSLGYVICFSCSFLQCFEFLDTYFGMTKWTSWQILPGAIPWVAKILTCVSFPGILQLQGHPLLVLLWIVHLDSPF